MSYPITILLSTYNGSRYLSALLDSLEKQTQKSFHLIIRDDGSPDDTYTFLKCFKADSSLHITLLPQEKNLGIRQSFSVLLQYALKHTDAQYFMFCDQDDVWMTDKVKRTMQQMQTLTKNYPDAPLLVHTDLSVVDETLRTVNPSFWHYEHIIPSYNTLNRLLMQNTVTGCTMMINRQLAELSLPIPQECAMHDWWIALTAAVFGKIDFLPESTIFYRQHDSNTIGTNDYNRLSNFVKFFLMLSGQNEDYLLHLEERFIQAEHFLKVYRECLDEHTIQTLEAFCSLKEATFMVKRMRIIKYKFYKHNFFQNISMMIRI